MGKEHDMKMKRAAIVLIALAIASTGVAQEFQPYLSLGGGGVFLEVDHRDGGESHQEGAVVEGAFGLAYKEDVDASALRVELALSFQKNDFSDAEVETSAVMANGYFDISTETAITPYFLVGIGRSLIDIDWDDDGSDNDNVFAYQFGGGIGYSMADNVILDLKYKYFATEDFETSDIKARFNTHQLQFGVRYLF